MHFVKHDILFSNMLEALFNVPDLRFPSISVKIYCFQINLEWGLPCTLKPLDFLSADLWVTHYI
jgi:hypothetical protein